MVNSHSNAPFQWNIISYDEHLAQSKDSAGECSEVVKREKTETEKFVEEALKRADISRKKAQEEFDNLSEAEQKEYLKARSILRKRMSDIPLTDEEIKWQAGGFNKKTRRKPVEK